MTEYYIITEPGVTLPSGRVCGTLDDFLGYYNINVNKNAADGGYPDFRSWLADMLKTGLIEKPEIPCITKGSTLLRSCIIGYAREAGIPEENTCRALLFYNSMTNITDEHLYLIARELIGNADDVNGIQRCMAQLNKELITTYRIQNSIRNAVFTSVWDGRTKISAPCRINLDTKEVFDIETRDADGLDTLDREYITVNGTEYPVYSEDEADDGEFWYD